MTWRTAITLLQGLTFVALAVIIMRDGDWRLAAAQALLALVTVLVYV